MKLFNMDLHASVIEDFKSANPGIEVVAWSLSYHAPAFKKQTKFPEIINPNTWESLSPKLIDAFCQKYDSFLRQFDGFICGHPNSFAMIFERYNKPILLMNTCRYDIPFCFANNLSLRQYYHERLHSMRERGLLTIVSNNKADVLYTRKGVGLNSIYIPSLCDYLNTTYRPTKSTFMLYRGSLPDHPLVEKRPDFFRFEELGNYRGIIHFPYEISTMSMFEQYTAGLPMFFPSREMMNTIPIQSITAYWRGNTPEPLKEFDDNNLWLDNADFYNLFTDSPNVHFFNSVEHLFQLLENFVYVPVDMSAYKNKLRAQWRRVMKRFSNPIANTGQIKVTSNFGKRISDYAADTRFTRYLEIGSWTGRGSTCAVFEGFCRRPDEDAVLQSYEINRMRAREAIMTWKDEPQINIITGRILDDNEFPSFQTVYVKFPNLSREWHQEDSQNFWSTPYVPPNNPEVVILDGGEYLSYFEFQKLIGISSIKVFLLDDTEAAKNNEVKNFLASSPEWKFVDGTPYEGNGWAIFEKSS